MKKINSLLGIEPCTYGQEVVSLTITPAVLMYTGFFFKYYKRVDVVCSVQ